MASSMELKCQIDQELITTVKEVAAARDAAMEMVGLLQCEAKALRHDAETMAKALIEAHSCDCRWCPHTCDPGACEDQQCVEGRGCKCSACEAARRILA